MQNIPIEDQTVTIDALLTQLELATTVPKLDKCLESARARWLEWGNLPEGGKLNKLLRHHATNFYKLKEFRSKLLERKQEKELIQTVINAIGMTARVLSEWLPYHQSMCRVLVDFWNALGEYQTKQATSKTPPCHIYRAGVAMYLALIYYSKNELGAAMWWLLLAQADDLLDEHGDGGGAGKDMLQLSFGVGDDVLDEMKRIAGECLSGNQPHQLYAEHVIMQLALKLEYLWLFSFATTMRTFPVCPSYASAMTARLVNESLVGNERAATLEDLARYFVLLMAGWVPSRNLYATGTHIDSDVKGQYTREPERVSEPHARAILVECKNYQKAVSVSQLAYFLYRMQMTHINVGILFAQNGISGGIRASSEPDESQYAQRLLEQAFQRDRKSVIVVNNKVLNRLADGSLTLLAYIESELIKLRFGTENTESRTT